MIRLKPGDTLRERYQIVEIIGQGGMGCIYKAADLRLEGRFTAIKEIYPNPHDTPDGLEQDRRQFQREASILARKEIFASRIRRLPIFRWLIAMLRAGGEDNLKIDVVQTALELELPPEEAARQLEIAISWGRYAEIIEYDDDTQLIHREPAAA